MENSRPGVRAAVALVAMGTALVLAAPAAVHVSSKTLGMRLSSWCSCDTYFPVRNRFHVGNTGTIAIREVKALFPCVASKVSCEPRVPTRAARSGASPLCSRSDTTVVVCACFCRCRFDHEIPKSRPWFICAAFSVL